MPGLQSFCVCTAISLLAIYLLQVTFFIACMKLDHERILSKRIGILPCVFRSDEAKRRVNSHVTLGRKLFHHYAKLLPSSQFKILVLLATCVITGLGISGCGQLERKFDFILLLPEESYLHEWHNMKHTLYPDQGWVADIYTDTFDYFDLKKFENLTVELEKIKRSEKYIKG